MSTKSIIQYSLKGEPIRKWDSVTEAAKSLGVSVASLVDCCRGRSQTYAKHLWAYETVNAPIPPREVNNFECEEWRDIMGFIGVYQVSNYGRIRSCAKAGYYKIMKPHATTNGYLIVGLSNNGIRRHYSVHRIVAAAFIPNPYDFPCVNHKDENKQNNRVENLEWCTILYNNMYSDRMERVQSKRRRPIIQYDLSGKPIAKYSCVREASEKTGISQNAIYTFCYGKYYKDSLRGYKWAFQPTDTHLKFDETDNPD